MDNDVSEGGGERTGAAQVQDGCAVASAAVQGGSAVSASAASKGGGRGLPALRHW